MTRVRPDFDMLAGVAQHHGINFARSLQVAIEEGDLIDMGPCELPRKTVETLPPPSFPSWAPIPREPVEPPARHLELAREIQQLKLGAS